MLNPCKALSSVAHQYILHSPPRLPQHPGGRESRHQSNRVLSSGGSLPAFEGRQEAGACFQSQSRHVAGESWGPQAPGRRARWGTGVSTTPEFIHIPSALPPHSSRPRARSQEHGARPPTLEPLPGARPNLAQRWAAPGWTPGGFGRVRPARARSPRPVAPAPGALPGNPGLRALLAASERQAAAGRGRTRGGAETEPRAPIGHPRCPSSPAPPSRYRGYLSPAAGRSVIHPSFSAFSFHQTDIY